MSNFDYLRNQTVLVTGAAGTIGRALTQVLLPIAKAVRCFDHSENDLFFLQRDLEHTGRLSPQIGDVRDIERLRFSMQGVDVVFHTAALKHVGLGEYNPFEVVQTNLHGLNNVIRAALDTNVQKVIFTSSDKAVNPTNVMGASKMMGERLITAANEIRGPRSTRFASVRFGNVIGSRGSVVPIFAQQLLRGEAVTITDVTMTRYIMTIEEAASLVIEAGSCMRGGEVFVTKMHAVRVLDLAHAMAQILSHGQCQIKIVGPRPGEKLYEELLSLDEMSRTVDLERLLVVLAPAESFAEASILQTAYPNHCGVKKEWISSKDKFMTHDELVTYLTEKKVLEPFVQPGTAF